MSEELIFDSERQEQREARKRWLLPCLVLVGILLLAVTIALIIRAGKGDTHSGGQDTDYPFTWALRSDGDTELAIPHADAPDCRWILKDGEASLPILRITRKEKKEGSEGTVFTLHPEQTGRCIFTLILSGTEEGAERIYEMTFLAEVSEADGKLGASLLNASGTRFQTELSGGDGGENSYRIFTNAKGMLVVSIPTDEAVGDWEYELPTGEENLEIVGLLYEDGKLNAYLRAGENAGSSELVLRSEDAYTTIRLKLESGADGSLQVVSHEAEYEEKPVTEPTTEEPTNPDGDQVASTAPLPIETDHMIDDDLLFPEEPVETAENAETAEANANP